MSLVFLPLIALALFLVVRANPQRKRVAAQQAMINQLAPGDRVITASGMIGTLVAVEGDRAALEIAPDVIVEFLLPAISRRLVEGGSDAAPGAPAIGGLAQPADIDVPDDLSSMELPHDVVDTDGGATDAASGDHDADDAHAAHPSTGPSADAPAPPDEQLADPDPSAPRPEEY